MDTTVGTCGLCGGRVAVASAYMSTIPPIPQCQSCGARPSQPYGPVIPMDRPSDRDRDAIRNRKPEFWKQDTNSPRMAYDAHERLIEKWSR